MIRIFGDVHGNIEDYVLCTKQAPSSVQLGDMGFDYSSLNELDPRFHVFVGGNHDNYTMELVEGKTNPTNDLETLVKQSDKFFLSPKLEHDIRVRPYLPYVLADSVFRFTDLTPHYLGNFGNWQIPYTKKKLFFVRGAWSIDQKYRFEHRLNWYVREQMSLQEMEKALDAYEKEKPEFVVSHTAPTIIMKHIFGENNYVVSATSRLLEMMFQVHAPKIWIFGHLHIPFDEYIDDTHFIGLNAYPLEKWSVDIDEHLEVIGFDKHVQL